MTKNICVFIDRDGVINKEKKDYIKSEDEFEFIFGIPKYLKKLSLEGIKLFLVTNQKGIEAGVIKEEEFLQVNRFMVERLSEFNVEFDAIYYSPWIESYNTKPNPGMILSAIKDYNLKNHIKYMIGDKLSDIIAGNSAGCTTILVKTGYGKESYNNIKTLIETPDYYVNDLNVAVDLILDQKKERLHNR